MPQAPKNFEEVKVGGAKSLTAEMDAYNQQAFDDYNTKALERCEMCGRTFLPERLVIHQRSCKGGGSLKKGTGLGGKAPTRDPPPPSMGKPSPKPKQKKSPRVGAGPPGIVCYICGRKYGTKSIDIHQTQCAELWEKTESQKPKSER